MASFQIAACSKFMSTWLDLCPFHRANHTCLPSLTATHGGQRPYRWLMPQPPHVPVFSCHITLHSSVCQQTSPLIGAAIYLKPVDNPGETLLGSTTHRQKALLNDSTGSLKRHSAWLDELPLVLLGLRSALKEGLGCVPAELVYGTTIRLPGEFFECTPAAEPDTSDLLTHLRNTMVRLRPK